MTDKKPAKGSGDASQKHRAERTPEEQSRIQAASGFQADKEQLPVEGERVEEEGGTVAARPPTSSLPADKQNPPPDARQRR